MSKGTLPKILLKFWDAIGSDRSAILRTKLLLISCLRLFGSNDIRHQRKRSLSVELDLNVV